MEQWKTIHGFKKYEASSDGLLRSINYKRTGRTVILKPAKRYDGYLQTMLQGDDGKYRSKLVHYFVTLAFFGERDKGLTVNHIDGNKCNNRIDNLEYVTQSENAIHSFRTGLQKPKKGTLNGNCKLTNEDVIYIREYRKTNGRFYDRKMLSEKFGVSEFYIKEIVSKRRGIWSHI